MHCNQPHNYLKRYIYRARGTTPALEVAEVIQRTHRYIRTGWSPHKRVEDCDNGPPSMLQPWQIVRFGINEVGDKSELLLPKATEAAVKIPRVWCGYGYGVLDEASSCAERHRMGGTRAASAPPPPRGEVHTYWIYFPEVMTCLRCPVEGCQGVATIWTNLHVHFLHRYMWDAIVILEEGNIPYPIYGNYRLITVISSW